MFRKQLYRAYPSDLTDVQWEVLEPLIPPLSPEAVYWLHERREIESAHPVRVEERLPVEIASPRFACLGHRLLLLPQMATPRGLGSCLGDPTHADACQRRPKCPAQCRRH